MKKLTLTIFCVFTVIIIFFSVFGGMIRQSMYIPVTTAKVELMYLTVGMKRVVPNEAIHTDIYGETYIWLLTESDDIGEKYYYADKRNVNITYQDDIYTGISGLSDGTIIIVTSTSELQDKTKVKVIGEFEK